MRLAQSWNLLCVLGYTARWWISRIKAKRGNRWKMQAADLISVSPPSLSPPPVCDLDGICRYHTWHRVQALHRKYLCLTRVFACFSVFVSFPLSRCPVYICSRIKLLNGLLSFYAELRTDGTKINKIKRLNRLAFFKGMHITRYRSLPEL